MGAVKRHCRELQVELAALRRLLETDGCRDSTSGPRAGRITTVRSLLEAALEAFRHRDDSDDGADREEGGERRD
ncbi:hypothetical protein A6E15_07075 [Natrinema saccharevitans]|uniref:Uncharacterized protein n=1 Tax=Natrinema saccharevitans TaxID=301967 RepID=A0A1S8AWN4_9EURY|nr:hypothetical protein [Natrinema saccharevitans]OLZ40764.1 hypothetical protein A6E15_07075 [Natrinema saccharevitans]